MAAIIVPLEIGRRRFAAEIAVDALVVHVESAPYVFGVFICRVSHFSL
jgi:hypothetical protein